MAGPIAAASRFNLSGAGADVVQLDAVTGKNFSNAIAGFGAGDSIVLPNVNFAAGGAVTIVGNTLIVPLLGGEGFTFSNFTTDGTPTFAVGTHSLQTSSVACFAAGTRIRTRRGDIAVEALRAG